MSYVAVCATQNSYLSNLDCLGYSCWNLATTLSCPIRIVNLIILSLLQLQYSYPWQPLHHTQATIGIHGNFSTGTQATYRYPWQPLPGTQATCSYPWQRHGQSHVIHIYMYISFIPLSHPLTRTGFPIVKIQLLQNN